MKNVIVALDSMDQEKAIRIAYTVHKHPLVWGFKVNDLLVRYGATIVGELKRFGKVFADPKFYDIPNTMTNSIRVLEKKGADIVSVHLDAKYKPEISFADKLAGITILTSSGNLTDIDWFCNIANAYGYGYVVCSGNDVGSVKRHFSKQVICPGIRPSWSSTDDQKAVCTPRHAIDEGADLLVVGRPITMAENPLKALDELFGD